MTTLTILKLFYVEKLEYQIFLEGIHSFLIITLGELEQVLKALIQRRQRLKSIAGERKQKLNKSKEFFEFKNQCDDLSAWINERRRHALGIYGSGESTDLHTIDRHLNKHEALEKEMNANRTRLEKLKHTAAAVDAVAVVVPQVTKSRDGKCFILNKKILIEPYTVQMSFHFSSYLYRLKKHSVFFISVKS